MNIGGIIFLKWAVCMHVQSIYFPSLAHFYRWKKKQQLQVIGRAKISNTKLSTLQREFERGYYA